MKKIYKRLMVFLLVVISFLGGSKLSSTKANEISGEDWNDFWGSSSSVNSSVITSGSNDESTNFYLC